MKADEKLAFSGDQKRQLNEEIDNLQQYFFARPSAARNGEHDLAQVARRWLSCAR
jgi:hypothetical protein